MTLWRGARRIATDEWWGMGERGWRRIGTPNSCMAREIDRGRRGSRAVLGLVAPGWRHSLSLCARMAEAQAGWGWGRCHGGGGGGGGVMAVVAGTRILGRWCRGRGGENGEGAA
jgi:hypothetical protein